MLLADDRMDNQVENRVANGAEYRTINELIAPDIFYQPLYIDYPKLDANFELKFGSIHLLPKFHGLVG